MDAPAVVLDASALLAFLRNEAGAAAVEAALEERAAISAVNWAETLSKVVDLGADHHALAHQLKEEGILGVDLVVYPLSEEQAAEIAALRRLTRPDGLSLGDRACLALGRALGLPVLTAERAWTDLPVGVEIWRIR